MTYEEAEKNLNEWRNIRFDMFGGQDQQISLAIVFALLEEKFYAPQKIEPKKKSKYCTINIDVRRSGETVQCKSIKDVTIHLAGGANFECRTDRCSTENIEVLVNDEWLLAKRDKFTLLETQD